MNQRPPGCPGRYHTVAVDAQIRQTHTAACPVCKAAVPVLVYPRAAFVVIQPHRRPQ